MLADCTFHFTAHYVLAKHQLSTDKRLYAIANYKRLLASCSYIFKRIIFLSPQTGSLTSSELTSSIYQ